METVSLYDGLRKRHYPPNKHKAQDCNSEAPPAVKRNKVSSFQKKQEQLLDTTNKILNTKEDDWEIIGRSIGVQLRDLTANQKVIAKKLISDVIFYASTEQLTNNSFVSIPSSSIIPSPSPSPTSVTFPLTSPQYEYNENSLNHPKIYIKRRPKPSSTSIDTQQSAASPSSANSPPNFGTISQDDRRHHEELSRNMSPLPPSSGNTSHSLNHPKIIIKRPPKTSSTPIGSQQYVVSPLFANSPQINNSLGAISQDDNLEYVNNKQSSIIYEGKGSQLGQFLLYNKKHEK
ncbi:uncharacterized protein LOC123666279 isoform X2 [Melitaea cinxia]|uniref:uncharacterized protein LOC123666279 isoform X2 n=1 Tax=Melitaea cinxia TaxID=113334 RepID=UPI001E271E0D|nr:uncharacterized protein LOC123666279 isoform X2 [Melitaea cinxia]